MLASLTGLIASSGAGVFVLFFIIYLAVVIFMIAGTWKMFEKAGKPGWAAIIPFYNSWTMCQVAKRPGWWFVLLLIPIVNVVIWVIVAIDAAKAFGKGTGFGVLTVFFPYICFTILGFSDARYEGVASTN